MSRALEREEIEKEWEREGLGEREMESGSDGEREKEWERVRWGVGGREMESEPE